MTTIDRPSRRAVVIGASMSGLLAARVLADHFDEVEVLDRDPLPTEPAHRKGVPHGRHAHGLLAAGGQALERFFPGLMRDLAARGAMPGDPARDLRWFQCGVYKARCASGVEGMFVSRPLLEQAVRARVASLPNVRVLAGVDACGLTHAGERVTGVSCRDARGGVAPRAADLVVDASGRGSRTPAWLVAMRYDAPTTETVPVDVTYTTRVLERRPGDLDGALGMIVPPHAPAETRGAALLAMEDGRWIVTLIGMVGDRAPADDAGFLAYARSLGTPEIGALVARARPLSDFETYHFAASVRRRYERLRRFPLGLVVVGDALASFNPIYGQGMTVASQEAHALDEVLRDAASGAPGTLAPRFFRRAARIVDNPWTLAVGEDLRYPQVPGPRPLSLRLLHRYVAAVHQASATDTVVSATFIRVSNMLDAPPALLRLAVASRVALAAWRARRARRGERRSVAATAAPSR